MFNNVLILVQTGLLYKNRLTVAVLINIQPWSKIYCIKSPSCGQFLGMRQHAHKTVCMNGANRYEHGAMRKQRENANTCGSCESCEATEQLTLYGTVGLRKCEARSNP
jgi:hypothetical protein